MQTQQFVRSTVTLPTDLHKRLKMEALDKRMSFSDLVLDKLEGSKEDKMKKVAKALSYFETIRQRPPFFDGAKAIRDDRDNHDVI